MLPTMSGLVRLFTVTATARSCELTYHGTKYREITEKSLTSSADNGCMVLTLVYIGRPRTINSWCLSSYTCHDIMLCDYAQCSHDVVKYVTGSYFSVNCFTEQIRWNRRTLKTAARWTEVQPCPTISAARKI